MFHEDTHLAGFSVPALTHSEVLYGNTIIKENKDNKGTYFLQTTKNQENIKSH